MISDSGTISREPIPFTITYSGNTPENIHLTNTQSFDDALSTFYDIIEENCNSSISNDENGVSYNDIDNVPNTENEKYTYNNDGTFEDGTFEDGTYVYKKEDYVSVILTYIHDTSKWCKYIGKIIDINMTNNVISFTLQLKVTPDCQPSNNNVYNSENVTFFIPSGDYTLNITFIDEKNISKSSGGGVSSDGRLNINSNNLLLRQQQSNRTQQNQGGKRKVSSKTKHRNRSTRNKYYKKSMKKYYRK
jgi:hypothetical protein